MSIHYLAVPSLIIVITSFLCGVWIYFKNPKNIVHITWTLFSIFTCLWAFCNFFLFQSDTYKDALFWGRALNYFAQLIPIFFFHFVCSFLDINKYKRKEFRIYYIITFLFLFITLILQNSYIPSMKYMLSFYAPNPGILYYFTTFLFSYLVVYGVILLFKAIPHSTPIKKNQIRYVLLGFFVGFLSCSMSFLPVYNIPIAPIGIYLGPAYIFGVTYAIIKYELLDIKVMITRGTLLSFVYAFVLGIPFFIVTFGKPYFISFFGDNWQMYFTLITIIVSTLGLITYNFLRVKADEMLLNTNKDLLLGAQHLKKYLPKQVGDLVFKSKKNIGYSRKKITIFFSDIEKFTEVTDILEPEELAEMLNEYLEEMTYIAHKWGGTVDKFIGDAIMVFFGAPNVTNEKDHAFRCVKMAIEMQKKMKGLKHKWFERGIEHPLLIRVGISTGLATVGNFGSSDRFSYTAIGSQVNLAARLEAKCESGKILVNHSTWSLVNDKIKCVLKDELDLKGIARKVKAYEIIP